MDGENDVSGGVALRSSCLTPLVLTLRAGDDGFILGPAKELSILGGLRAVSVSKTSLFILSDLSSESCVVERDRVRFRLGWSGDDELMLMGTEPSRLEADWAVEGWRW